MAVKKKTPEVTPAERIRGCLFGGAIGDALGAPVEFLKFKQIMEEYGPGGIQDLDINNNGKAEITDDTQMTLFVAEGFIEAITTGTQSYITVRQALKRWYDTQDQDWAQGGEGLAAVEELHSRRAPGNTCLGAIQMGATGRPDRPINDSKGCGGVMRAAPAGLLYPPEEAFKRGLAQAALTHGHVTGYFTAGAFAMIISYLTAGLRLKDAVVRTLAFLKQDPNPGLNETIKALQAALNLHKGDLPRDQAIASLGEGWTADEALAIAVYCALERHDDYRAAIIQAVNHDGDSDSTGSMTGQLIGTYLGYKKIPQKWTKAIEGKKAIAGIAADIRKIVTGK